MSGSFGLPFKKRGINTANDCCLYFLNFKKRQHGTKDYLQDQGLRQGQIFPGSFRREIG
jgi:hypothetical protein